MSAVMFGGESEGGMRNIGWVGRGAACVVALAVAGVAGCEEDDDFGTVPRDGGAGTGGVGAGAGGAGGTSAAALNDARIAGIVLEANAGEVHAAELAKSRSTNPAVLDFADRMITDHQGVTTRVHELLDRKGMVVEDSEQRRMLSTQTMQILNQLWAAPAASFDAAYAGSQVTMHDTLLDMLDRMLIPAAQDGDLSAELTMTRASVAMHHTHAQQLAAEVGGVGGASDGGTGSGADGGTGTGGAAGTGLGTGTTPGTGEPPKPGMGPAPVRGFGL